MRLDNFLVEKKYFDSRTKAKQAIERGEIYINGKIIKKVAFEVCSDSVEVDLKQEDRYVSLGGYKLKKALKDFNFSVENLICADIGASTGGFTDCLLKNGAKKVFAVDLNNELLHQSLKDSDKVFPIIKNVKNLSKVDFNRDLDLVVADLSFISITQALPILSSLIDDGKYLIILIKPQFENDSKIRFKNGVIRDKKIQIDACKKVYSCAIENFLAPIVFTTAPICEDKNIEFLMCFIKNGDIKLNIEKINF